MSDPYSAFRGTKLTGSDIIQQGEGRWWNGSFSGGSLYAGMDVSYDNLMTSATCFACTKALAETIAGLPDQVFQDFGDRRELAEGVDPHYLLAVEPNPEMDSFTFWELAATRIVNRGNFFAEIQRNNRDEPIALWPIHNSRVEPMRDVEDGSLYWRIHGDYTGAPEYEDPTWRREYLTYLPARNMLNIVGFGSHNGIISNGVLPAAQEISTDMAMQKFGASFFGRGASLSGIVEHPGYIDNPTTRLAFRQDLNQIHAARDNPHGIGVLWQGATYKQISVSPEQAQFLESRRFTSHQICKFYGVPPGIVGDLSESKYATADAMIRSWVMTTLRNLVVRIERAIMNQVLSARGENGKLRRAFTKKYIYRMCLEGLLRGDPKTQAETNQILRQNGVIDADEWRSELGKNPLGGEHGKYVIVPGGYVRLDKIDNQGSRQNNAQPEKQNASLPTFDRQRVAQLIQDSGLASTQTTQVQGFDPKAKIFDAILSVAQDAVNRIHAITLQQLARWKEPTADQLEEFTGKQITRLEDALKPCDNLCKSIEVGMISQAMSVQVITDVMSLPLEEIRASEPTDITPFIENLKCSSNS